MDIRSTMNSRSPNRPGPGRTCPHALALAVACALAAPITAATAPHPPVPGPGEVDFNRQIRPILSSQCFTCHGPDDGSRKARLRLDVRDDAIRDRGGIHAILPGDADNSEVLLRVLSTDPREVMPPPKHGRPLSPDESALLRRWIDEGAVYADHWAWARPQRPNLPAVSQPDWPRNAVDRFVLARLDQEKLTPARAADPHALIRRVAIDLTGLPPTPEQVRMFMDDPAPDAYERMVDRFLASPAYGERWARVWLDLARYADSAGYGSDPLRPNIWPWRDWVIEALNRNLPYDQFTIKQLAGDLLPDPTEAQRVATAFHRNTMTNTEGGTDDEEYRIAAVKDRANVTGQVWMGLTVGCAECHSHKFDPLSHREYYQWFAFFNQTEDNDQPDERPTLPLPNPEQRTEMDRLRAQISGARVRAQPKHPGLRSGSGSLGKAPGR
jgi:hypothetical protein